MDTNRFLQLYRLDTSWLFALVLVTTSCNISKYLPEDEFLYTGAHLEIVQEAPVKGMKAVREELQGLLRPKPNSKILGQYLGLWAHYKMQQEHPGFINRFIYNRLGEEPVYFSQVQPEKTEELLLNRLDNNGFFYAEVLSTSSRDAKKADITYQVTLPPPYSLRNYYYEQDSLPIDRHLKELLESSELTSGDRFALDKMKAERERINTALKNRGFYNFNPDYLIFEADTNQYEGREYDLYVRLKESVPEEGILPYQIRSIRVFPNYSLDEYGAGTDTTRIEGVEFIQEQFSFKPELLRQYLLIEKGGLFNAQRSRLTSNRLSGIGNYRFVNIRYTEVAGEKDWESGLLDANIYLSPLDKRSVRAELQGVSKSNNFAGPALLLNYRNRNLFFGGETFDLTGKVAYESQIASGEREGLNAFEFGLKGDLIFPRVVFPIPIKERFAYSVPKTKISLGSEYQDRRGLYRLNSLSASYGYFWNANRFVYHEITPISLNFVDLSNTSGEFEEILNNNPFLRQSFEQQFIAGVTYSYAFNKLMDTYRTHSVYVGVNMDLAGFGLRFANNVFNGADPNTFLGFTYAQYNKGDIDFRYYLRFTEEKLLALRLFGGAGLPYGNSVSLPFVKQYFSGGPSSVRAFRIRSLGPGSFRPDSETTANFFDQAGDVRIEGNLEFRFPIFSYLKGAVFADAGNVWLINENEALPGGKLGSDWYRELGIGVGLGLRVDIEFFVLRFDLATPLRRPYPEEGQRWERDFRFGDNDWRKENFIFNFAIGYPF
ncbi:Outer membrane protein assembly factor BamA [Cyclobacterium xiamenense]|uniref:Outer membrane protein assembly factor BamA n=1 Tax=Cyclobacterium xiamenense TaxID=1297121 RepID=A0A1H6Z2C5_9BACT|nr:BamA/TamA family outer membrane protein [Cyclobacterium xiamenense]SEJ46826.1 Outer membrane protein assembly factor BamA [Cyclobacterium xiamenense]